MTHQFEADVWYWRGPAPFFFATVPPEIAAEIRALQKSASYGWGMMPVNAQVGNSRWRTAMFPKDGSYVLPLKDAIRRAEDIEEGSSILVTLEIELPFERRQSLGDT